MSTRQTPAALPVVGLVLTAVIAHFFTAIIQYQPYRIQGIIGDLPPLLSGLIPFFPILTVGLFLLSLFRSGASPMVFSGNLISRLGGFPAAFLLLGLLLPQRVMDTNSGYTQIFPDSPLFAVMTTLDFLRTACAFHLFRLLFSAPSAPASASVPPSASEPVSGLPSASPPTTAATDPIPEKGAPLSRMDESGPLFSSYGLPTPPMIALGVLILASLVQHHILENIPHVQDEISQHWQARVFASGSPAAPAQPLRESFAAWGLVDNGVRLFSSFQPGQALLLRVLVPWGLEGLLNPLLGALAVLLFAYLSGKMLQIRTGIRTGIGTGTSEAEPDRLAVLLFGCSPFFLLMCSGRMNHVLALVLFLVVAIGWSTSTQRPVRSAILCGLAGGLLLMTRRVDGGITVLTVLAGVLTTSGSRRSKATFLAVFLMLTASLFFLQTSLNKAHSGDSLQMMRQVVHVIREYPETSLFALFQNLFDNITGFTVFAFGGVISGFAALGMWGLPAGALKQPVGFFLRNHLLLTIVAYSLYDYQDFCYGPRFWFSLLPGMALTTSELLRFLGRAISPIAARRWLQLSLLMALFLFGHQVWSLLGNRFWNVSTEFQTFLQTEIRQPTLVFLKSATRRRLDVIFPLKGMGAPPEVLKEIAGIDALDFVGLRKDLTQFPPVFDEPLKQAIRRRMATARCFGPASHDIAESEVIRLNSSDPFSQGLIIAQDLGDEPNQALIQRLPKHLPLFVCRSGSTFFLEPYRPSGVARFH